MPIRYSVTIVLILMIIALARGFVLSDIGQIAFFGPTHALADDGGDGGGDGGGSAGDGGGGDGGGDGGDGGDGGGDGGDGGDGGGDGTGDGGGDGTGDGVIWTRYCTGTDEGVPIPHPWEIWEYDNSTPRNYRFVEVGSAANGCLPPNVVWTRYCTGTDEGAPIPHPWEIWEYDNSTPPNFRFVEVGSAANGCVAPSSAPSCTLTIAPSTINSGDGASISWTTANATSFTIDQGIGSVTPVPAGSRAINPTNHTTTLHVTTTYTGTATGPGGTVTCSAPVTVISPPPACTLTASATSIQPGQSVTLTWSTFSADTFLIDQGIGTLFWWGVPAIPNGSVTVSPTVTTTYTGTARNGGGFSPMRSVQCPVTIVVAGQPPPATITVIKRVINDNGGTRTIADFPLFVNGASVTSGQTNAFTPGTYTITETTRPEYAASFSGDCDASGRLTLGSGENKTCIITNDDNPPSGAVSMVGSCPLPGTSGSISLSVSPNTPAVTFFALRIDRSPDSWDGSCSAPDSCPNVPATSGGTATYNFTTVPGTTYKAWAHPCYGAVGDTTSCNWAPSAMGATPVFACAVTSTITVIKRVINDNGGTRTIADFPLFVNGASVTSGQTNAFTPGTYTITETTRPEYAASFSGDCDASGRLTLGSGENKTCTITNNDNPPPPVSTIRVNKVVINDNGGTATSTSFALFVNGSAVSHGATNVFAPGTYTVTENTLPGYTFQSFSGDCDSAGRITLGTNENRVCTVTNNDNPPPPVISTIRVNKVVINDNGGTRTAADFPLFVSVAPGTATTSVTNGAVNTFNPGTYIVSETSRSGYTASFSGDCDASGRLTLGSGENKVCTITNNDNPGAIACTLTANPSSINRGDSSTLSWTTSNATSFTIDQGIGAVATTSGTRSVSPTVTTTYTGTAVGPAGTVSCSAPVTVGTGGGGCVTNCGGGGGGGTTPNVTLAALPHVGSQPLAYLYLSQVPYTGLELGPIGTLIYWTALIAWALAFTYLILFGAAPRINRGLKRFGSRVVELINAEQELAAAHAARFAVRATPEHRAEPRREESRGSQSVMEAAVISEAPRPYSTFDGFKSFAHNGALSIEDIVKSLSREPAPVSREERQAPVPRVEPIYENVEPMYNERTDAAREADSLAIAAAPASMRGFLSALLEGDRGAVFAGLRQHVRGGGDPEDLITTVACMLDDAYRARIDGTPCDADTVRMTARFATPVLEKLISALSNAIDSSYSVGATGAKMALTRALSVLGA